MRLRADSLTGSPRSRVRAERREQRVGGFGEDDGGDDDRGEGVTARFGPVVNDELGGVRQTTAECVYPVVFVDVLIVKIRASVGNNGTQ